MNLKTLKIKNLVLIENAEISFDLGLNIITGESGSGKSVLLTAIRLIAGARADASLVREGAEFAFIETLLEGDIYLRREIYRSGKNRCFIDDSQVTLSEFKEAVGIDLVSQNSSTSLFEEQKLMLDTFGKLTQVRKDLENSIQNENKLSKELDELKTIPRERELEWASQDLERIEKVDFQSEESLMKEHHLLTHSQGLLEKMSAVSFALTDSAEIAYMKKTCNLLAQAGDIDPKLKEQNSIMKTALLELEEVGIFSKSYVDSIDIDPKRLKFVEASLGEIDQLKKRFGSDIDLAKQKLTEKVDLLTTLEEKIEEKEYELTSLKEKNEACKKFLTAERKKVAATFQNLILEELRSLNLVEARFEIYVGDRFNDLSFLFSANPGQELKPLSLCASGGELSRILLVIKTLLADGTSTLVFDEIDSNIGGKTALVLGQKLKKLSKNRQVISVTHFVQVAKCASVHFLVSKEIQKTHAFTKLRKLSEKEKQIEYCRMLGQEL